MPEKSTPKSQSLATAILAAGLSMAAMIGTYNVTSQGVTEAAPDTASLERVATPADESEIKAAMTNAATSGEQSCYWYAPKNHCRCGRGRADYEVPLLQADCVGSLVVVDGDAYMRRPDPDAIE